MSEAIPDDRKQNCATAQEVYQEEDLLPEAILSGALLRRLNNDVCHVSQDLERVRVGREDIFQ